MFAKFVAIEGPDKHGKATQTQLLAHALRRYGAKIALVEVPYKDKLTYPLIYKMLNSDQARKYPNLFQFVQFLNKFMFQWTKLLLLWLTNSVVVFDRWSLSSIVYGDATGVNKTFNRIMSWLLVRPTITIVLSGTSHKRNSVDDAYERDNELQVAVRKGYADWVEDHFEDHYIVDNQGTIDDVHRHIMFFVKGIEE